MEWIRRWTAQIHVQLSDLTVSTKLLIGTLLVVIPIMLWLVVQYAARPHMEPLLDQPMSVAERTRIESYLQSRGIAYQTVADRLLVPPDRRLDALAGLQLQQLLPEDTSRGFDAIIERQTWWQSSEQNRQLYNTAKMNVLAQVLRAYPWVRDATVIIDRPEQVGFGATARQPSASVNIVMADGRLDQHKVDAIAGLVSGAVAEMRPEDVKVIDAGAGRQWTVRREGEFLPGDYLQTVEGQERYYREKIVSALSYVHGVIVAVNVEVDLTRKQTDTVRYDRQQSVELLTMERSSSTQTDQPARGGEPGVRANTGVDIAGAGGAGAVSRTEEREAGFEPFAGKTHEVAQHPSGAPTRISATVNIPRSYFVRLFKMAGGGAETPDPTDQALAPIIQEHLDRIRKQVEPLVLAQDPGQVVVDVYPNGGPGVVAGLEGPAVASTAATLLTRPYIKLIALGALALVSFSIVLLTLRKAAQKPPTPSARELAGIPPSLPEQTQFVGEAGEYEATLPGMELDEEQMRHRKITEQVSEMVKHNPDEIARLVHRLARHTE